MREPRADGYEYIVGIDEAGRGPLAGPVTVGSVMIHKARVREFARCFQGIKDSKKLSRQKRERWFELLLAAERSGLLRFRVSFTGPSLIDRHGIQHAVFRSLASTLRMLACPSESMLLMDGGLSAPREYILQYPIIRGDEKIPLISLASIAAKVTRDRLMERLAEQYPEYGFDEHKGYGTAEHYKRIRKHGPSAIHRRSFLGERERSVSQRALARG